ncbi:MAG: redoxin domain-containing protein [Bacteroidetes bacterium]|nr:redoxin domain-containing protein [Bacteroidota bacterium]
MRESIHYKLILSVVLALCTLACSPESTTEVKPTTPDPVSPDPTETVTGEDAPNFSLIDLDGNTVKRSDFDGKVLVMFFFGSSCPSCIGVGSQIQTQLVDVYKSNDDFAIIGLDQWNGNNSAVSNFKTSSNVNFPLLLNASSVGASYKVSYDRLVVVDKVGKIRFRGNNLASTDLSKTVDVVKEYLDK